MSPFRFSASPEHPVPWNSGQRHLGLGKPLEGTSWRNRPLYAGWAAGTMLGDSLIHERVDQDAGMFGLYQLGWDFDHFWGTEARFGFASVDVAANDEGSEPGSSENLSWDVNLVHYPWGDSRWRPFLSAGFGLASFRFGDDDGQPVYETLYTIPLGCGVKYFYRPWLGLRFAVTDQLALGAYRLATMHNVCFAGGVEVRFGGARTSYYPYDTGTKWW